MGFAIVRICIKESNREKSENVIQLRRKLISRTLHDEFKSVFRILLLCN